MHLNIANYRKLFAKPAQRFWLVHHFRLVFDKQLSGNSSCSKVTGKENSYNMLHLDFSGRQNLLSSWSHSFGECVVSNMLITFSNKRPHHLLYKAMPQDTSWVFHHSNNSRNKGAIILNKWMGAVIIDRRQLSNLMKSGEPPVCLLSSKSMLSI